MMRKLFFSTLALLAVMSDADAKVRLPHLISDGMVIQQNSDVRLWGWAEPGRNVNVTVSWTDAVSKAKAGKDGRWETTVKSPKSGFTPLSITFDDGEPVTVSDVLAGEVWVCAGQSNMEMPLRGFGACPVEGYNETVAEAPNHPGIRFVKIPSVMSMTPLDDAQCEWKHGDDMNAVAECSAVGYYFARTVTSAVNVPVGLIMANKGGSRVESGLVRANLSRHTDESLDSMAMVKGFAWDFLRPLVWGNGTFHPILNYSVAGILYYQGCSNVGDPGNRYSERLKMLVEQWRRDFRQGELPFLFVQISPYIYGGADGDGGARLREQQFRASRIIPNSGLVCTNDLAYPYELKQIHPCRKRQVGERLAYMALSRYYGCGGLICESPSYASMRVSNDTCYVKLDNLYDGLSRLQDIEGFEVAGEDRVFYPARAEYEWHKGVMVSSDRVKHPVAVRYCFRNFALGNAANLGGLPLFPFRTDEW